MSNVSKPIWDMPHVVSVYVLWGRETTQSLETVLCELETLESLKEFAEQHHQAHKWAEYRAEQIWTATLRRQNKGNCKMKQEDIHTLGRSLYVIEQVHKDEIRAGDTILLDGEPQTVCNNNIRRGGFCGTTIHGESFKLGYELVKRVHFVCVRDIRLFEQGT